MTVSEPPSAMPATTDGHGSGDTPAGQGGQLPIAPDPAAGAEARHGVGEEARQDDADSALGDDLASSTASLNSSIFEYRKIHGRTFHKETGTASYWGSNDESHSESLDVLVLDIGTGTGIWAMDMADKFSGCEVIGTDISPIQPSWVPPNLKFEIEDCTQEWTFKQDDFDFVHIRYLSGSIVDWTAFFREAFKTLKPGGHLESYEGSPMVYSDDGTLPEGSAISQWGPLFIEGGKKIGRSFEVVDDGTQKKAMQEAGFVDIQEKLMKVPSGGWPADPKLRELGTFAQFAVEKDIAGFIVFFTSILNWTREEVVVYIARLRRELSSKKHHVYYYQRIVYGRKPE